MQNYTCSYFFSTYLFLQLCLISIIFQIQGCAQNTHYTRDKSTQWDGGDVTLWQHVTQWEWAPCHGRYSVATCHPMGVGPLSWTILCGNMSPNGSGPPVMDDTLWQHVTQWEWAPCHGRYSVATCHPMGVGPLSWTILCGNMSPNGSGPPVMDDTLWQNVTQWEWAPCHGRYSVATYNPMGEGPVLVTLPCGNMLSNWSGSLLWMILCGYM